MCIAMIENMLMEKRQNRLCTSSGCHDLKMVLSTTRSAFCLCNRRVIWSERSMRTARTACADPRSMPRYVCTSVA